MTMTEILKCQFCETAPATAIKLDDTLEMVDDDTEITVLTPTPICDDCHEAHYDGTEAHPALLPLP